MNTTRIGKIARLPHALRERLNLRLQDGEQGRKLIAWLNALPEVQAVLAAEFAGRPINDQNLSEWRHRGYRDWQEEREARELAAQMGREAVGTPDHPPLTETVTEWVVARYVTASRRLNEMEGEQHWRLLRQMCADVCAIRRGNHSAQRLVMRQERTPTMKRHRAMRAYRSLPRWYYRRRPPIPSPTTDPNHTPPPQTAPDAPAKVPAPDRKKGPQNATRVSPKHSDVQGDSKRFKGQKQARDWPAVIPSAATSTVAPPLQANPPDHPEPKMFDAPPGH